jgi:NAD(P)-dependent dehydrogenase (short-subunit alcohol dehydrogenase family)
MKRQRSGKIINISSIASRGLSQSSSSAYATAKGGIIAFTRKLSFELGPYGITCNAIAPSRMRDDLGVAPFLRKGALREMRCPHILRVPCLHLIFLKVLTGFWEGPLILRQQLL